MPLQKFCANKDLLGYNLYYRHLVISQIPLIM